MRTANARQVQTEVTEFVSIPAFSGRRRQAGIGGE
jgi:hypothetical protein